MSVRFPYSPVQRPPVPAVILDLSDPAGAVVIPSFRPIRIPGRIGPSCRSRSSNGWV